MSMGSAAQITNLLLVINEIRAKIDDDTHVTFQMAVILVYAVIDLRTIEGPESIVLI